MELPYYWYEFEGKKRRLEKQCIDGVEEAKRKAWIIFNRLTESSSPGAVKDSLLALKLTVDCNEAQFHCSKTGLQSCRSRG